MSSFESKLGVGFRRSALLLMVSLVLVACSSPEETANKYHDKGMALLEEGKLGEADEAFRHALKANDKQVKSWYGLALLAEKQGDAEQLFKLLKTVVDIDPKHLEAQLKLGRLLLAANQLEAASQISDTLLSLDKASPDVLAFQAAVLYKKGEKETALKLVQNVLAQQPGHVDASLLMALHQAELGDVSSAMSYVEQGLKKDGKHFGLSLLKIKLLLLQKDTVHAETVLRRLIDANPNARNLRQMLLRFYLDSNQKDKAEAVLREIAKKYPQELKAKLDIVTFVQVTKGGEAAIAELKSLIAADEKSDQLKFALVELYVALKKDNDARGLLSSLINNAKQDADKLKAKALLAEMHFKDGDVTTARKMISEVLEIDKRHVASLILQAKIALGERKSDQAIADLRTVLRESPDSALAAMLLGQAHEIAGALDLAQEQYQKSFESSKADVVFSAPYVEFLLRRGNVERAVKIADEVVKRAPNNTAALQLLARVYLANGNPQGVLDLAEQMKKVVGGEVVAEQTLGVLYASQKDFAKSIAAFRRAVELAPQNDTVLQGLVRVYLQSGKSLEAIEYLKQAMVVNPNHARASLLLAQVQVLAKQPAEAKLAFQKALSLDKKELAAYLGLIGLEIEGKNFVEAERLVNQALLIKPGNVDLLLNQARIYELSARFDQAIQLYERLLRDQPKSKLLINNLVSLLADHRTDKASLDRAYDLSNQLRDSDVAYFQDTIGWVSYRVGKTKEALEFIKAAVAKQPNEPVIRYHLGVVYVAVGDKLAAKKELMRAIDLAKEKPFVDVEKAKQALSAL